MKVSIFAHPYCNICGEIEIPDDVKESEIENYIEKHWHQIKFGEPDLDYACTDWEYELEDY